jgi:hypothetical protein
MPPAFVKFEGAGFVFGSTRTGIRGMALRQDVFQVQLSPWKPNAHRPRIAIAPDAVWHERDRACLVTRVPVVMRGQGSAQCRRAGQSMGRLVNDKSERRQ